MPGQHATGTLGILSSSELDRDVAGLQGTYGWNVQSGAVTFSAGLTFNVAAVAIGDCVVNSVTNTAAYAGGTVTLGTQDATLPRVDLVVITSGGAVSVVAGTPKALTTTSGPVPTAPSSSQLEIARIFVPATGTALTGANITDRRVPLGSAFSTIKKYKAATQTFSATTTYATVTAASGNFDFSIGANEVWKVDIYLPITVTGTGGLKLQFTGPAAPTAVHIGNAYTAFSTPISGGLDVYPAAPVAAFSSDIVAHNAAAATDALYATGTNGLPVFLTAYIANGANAGTVTLQGAQNSANGTTILGIGSMMRAERWA